MRGSLVQLFYKTPFENLLKHAEKVKLCAQMLLEAAEYYISGEVKKFDEMTEKVALLESSADQLKRNIRNHLPRGLLMPVEKFQFLEYLREQDKVLDKVEEALYWLSYRPPDLPPQIAEDLLDLLKGVVAPIEKLAQLTEEAWNYFRNGREQDRILVKKSVRDISQWENEADLLERELIKRVFQEVSEPLKAFHLIKLIGIIGQIADHAQNAGDRMRAMVAK